MGMADNYKIDTTILNGTTKCSDNFSCLFGQKDCLCEVENYVGNGSGVVFIQPQDKKFCNYKMSCGNGFICNCPTRYALYREYRI